MKLSRELAQATRRFADGQSDRLADVPSVRAVLLSVTSTAGGLFLSWRGATVQATPCASYTPGVGDWVLCLLVDDQLIAVDRI